eukprot:1157914-Pelagomonas_calceolata.AAC.8
MTAPEHAMRAPEHAMTAPEHAMTAPEHALACPVHTCMHASFCVASLHAFRVTHAEGERAMQAANYAHPLS